jgi:hypothetical protein
VKWERYQRQVTIKAIQIEEFRNAGVSGLVSYEQGKAGSSLQGAKRDIRAKVFSNQEENMLGKQQLSQC